MSKKKVYDLNASSGLGLSIELSKLQEKRKKEKNTFEQTGLKPSRKPLDKNIWNQKNKGLDKRSVFDKTGGRVTSTLEDQEAIFESQKSLEKKSKIYESLLKEGAEFDEIDENQLIDFEQKKWEQPVPISSNKFSENFISDPWVEYEDGFGRTRTIRQSELRLIQATEDNGSPDLPSDEIIKQQERFEWERKREEEAKGPIFYDADKEHRTRGVGFYKFSNREEERRDQMEQLNKIREETDRRRSLQKSIRDRRKEKLQERMSKIKKLASQKNQKAFFPPFDLRKLNSSLPNAMRTDIDIPLLDKDINCFVRDTIADLRLRKKE